MSDCIRDRVEASAQFQSGDAFRATPLANALGIKPMVARYALRDLRKQGRVERLGRGLYRKPAAPSVIYRIPLATPQRFKLFGERKYVEVSA